MVRASMVAGILAFTVCCFAQDARAGWFVGGSVGQSKVYDYSVGGPIDEEDDTDFAYWI